MNFVYQTFLMPLDETTREAVIWCPRCLEPRYEIHRVPADNEGVWQHVNVPEGPKPKRCVCGTPLERKP
jgi:hypothetical protein